MNFIIYYLIKRIQEKINKSFCFVLSFSFKEKKNRHVLPKMSKCHTCKQPFCTRHIYPDSRDEYDVNEMDQWDGSFESEEEDLYPRLNVIMLGEGNLGKSHIYLPMWVHDVKR